MKCNNYLIIMMLVLGVNYYAFAQIGINVDVPDESAMLDVSSNNKGVLFPRLNEVQRNSIIKPANGLVIFNTDCNTLDLNVGTPTHPNWKHLTACTTNPKPLLAQLDCKSIKINGTYKKSVNTNNTNTIEIDVKVTSLSSIPAENNYTITTNTVNGYSFSASGTFTSVGVQTITLNATGTPVNSGVNTFTISLGTSAITCSIDITVSEAALPPPSPVVIGNEGCGLSLGRGNPAYFDNNTFGPGGNSWSAMLYRKAEIGQSGNIAKINFLLDCATTSRFACSQPTNNQKVYMKLVDYDYFSSVGGTGYSNENISTMTKVFDGSVTWKKGYTNHHEWTEIVLDTPFPYDNTKNLLIYFVNEYGNTTSCLGSFGGPSFIVDAVPIGNITAKYAKYNPGAALPNTANSGGNQYPVIKIEFN